MAKKITTSEEINNQTVEKLRDELFDYRVDIKSYKRNLNAIMIAGTILISILTFFGYSNIKNIETTIMQRANDRLSQTDSILAKIDQTRIDSLNRLLLEKEQEYNVTIANLGRIVQQSMDLQMKLLESLSENERVKRSVDRYISEFPTDIFTIHPFNETLQEGEIEFVYLAFKDDVELSDDGFLSISLYPQGRNILLLEKSYKVVSKFNKLSFGLTSFENYKDYTLEISYFKKEGDIYKRYYIKKDVALKK